MTKPIRKIDGGIALVINNDGHEIPLYDDVRIDLPNIAGAQVVIKRRAEWITCDAMMPESKSTVRWHFFINDGDQVSSEANLPEPSLEKLIYDFRVAINGRL